MTPPTYGHRDQKCGRAYQRRNTPLKKAGAGTAFGESGKTGAFFKGTETSEKSVVLVCLALSKSDTLESEVSTLSDADISCFAKSHAKQRSRKPPHVDRVSQTAVKIGHRLIVRGATFESLVPEAKTMTDEEAAALLRLALNSEPAREYLKKRAEEATS